MKKAKYIRPTNKCVEFKPELGFAMSQGFRSFGISLDTFREEIDPDPDIIENPFGGYFTGNNDDWD